MLLLAGCQAVSGEAVATIDNNLTTVALESGAIRAAATAEQMMAVETIVAAGTRIADMAAVNALLGATVRAHHTGTPEVRAVVVNAEDMGNSLEDDMMAGESTVPGAAMSVSNLSTAGSLVPDSGCSTGAVIQFSPATERIYVTAEVSALQSGALFEVDWQFEAETVARGSWLADFSRSFVCIWFYATPVDFPFLPGNYSATLYAEGAAQGTTAFSIVSG